MSLRLGRSEQRQLTRRLKDMGLEYIFDPSVPTRQRFARPPKFVALPGMPYPPGYYTDQAMASIRFDRYIEALGRKDKIVPGKSLFSTPP